MQHSPVAQSKGHGADTTRLQRPRGSASANLELQWMWAVIQPLKLVLSYKHLALDNLCGLLVSQRYNRGLPYSLAVTLASSSIYISLRMKKSMSL